MHRSGKRQLANVVLVLLLLFIWLTVLFIAPHRVFPPAFAAPTELFFSEYVEGSGNNKAIEIFNGTGSAIDLAAENYDVQFYSNGNATPNVTILLTGTVTTNDVYVLADDNSAPAILTQADQTAAVSFFNGDDAIALRKNGVIIDVIGQIGNDPGSQWGSGSTSTQDNTLRRKSTIEAGDPNGSDFFDPATEWDGFAQDMFDGLGVHATSNPTATPTPTETATSVVTPTETSTATSTPIPASPGSVLINEIVTDPQQDWSSNGFNGIPGGGTVSSGTDEFMELFIKIGGLDLTGWTIELLDGSNITGDLTGSGAFQEANYVGLGGFTNTSAGDYLVLGNVAGSGAMNNNILIILRDSGSNIIDQVELGSDPEGDGSADDAPSGNATSQANEAVFRYPNGADTGNDAVDFITGAVTMGGSNDNGATPTPVPTQVAPILISEFLYDGETPSTEGDEFVELCNPNAAPVDLTGYKVGDEETGSGGESMYNLPTVVLAPGDCLVIAKNTADFQIRFGVSPDYEVSDLSKHTAWGSGSWSLANTGDELVVLGPGDQILDSIAFRNGDYAALGLEGGASAPQPHSLQRVWPTDTNSMPDDFVRTTPNPGSLTVPPPPPAALPSPATLPDGMNAYWGHLHAHTTYSDGAGPPHFALAMARSAGMHFYGITDHGWWSDSPKWAKTYTQTRAATVPGQFIALRGVEWSHDTAGHINVFNTNTLLSRTDPRFSTLPDLYTWLANNPNAIAQFNHPDPSYGGTFSDFALHPAAAQMVFMQEIGNNAQRYTTYEPSFVQSNAVGWRVAPANNGDTHSAQWGFDTPARTGIVAPSLTESDLLDAMRARRVFATEDSNLALALRVDGNWMGSVLSSSGPVSITVNVVDTDPEPVTLYLYDSNLLLESMPVAGGTGEWNLAAEALPGHHFWVKAVQEDGDVAYSAPVWIEGQVTAEPLVINEILPSPNDFDWDGNGTPDHTDEWIELYNPLNRPVGLGGWQVRDSSGVTFHIPLDVNIPAGGYVVLYQVDSGIGLNNGGDTLTLIHPNGTVVDTMSYDHSPQYDESWCRLPNGSAEWSDDCGPSPEGENWQLPANGPLKVSIFDVKRLAHNAWVRVKGWVTAPPGVLGSRAMYIQDETAGILIYLPKDHRLFFNRGDKVRVEGNLRTFHDEFEIAVDERSDVDFVEPGIAPPPLPIVTTSMLEPYEGMLVQLTGQAVRFQGSTRFWIDDGTDPAEIYIRRSTGIRKPFIEPGTPVTVIGIVSQYSEEGEATRYDYRLLPRYQSDLKVSQVEAMSTPPPGWPSVLPETGY